MSWTRLSLARLALPLVAVAALAACGGADAYSTGKRSAPPASSATDAAVASPTTAAGAAGVVYTPPEGDYQAVFPEQPTEQTQSQPLPNGGAFELKIVRVDLGKTALATARGTYPEGYQVDATGLQSAQDQTIASLHASLTSSREITLDGRPGREFSASVASNGQGGTLLERIYLDGPTLYEVLRTGAGKLAFSDPESVAFFGSFELTH